MTQHFVYLAVIFAMLTTTMYLAYDSYCAANDERCRTLSMTFLALFAAGTAVMLGLIAWQSTSGGGVSGGGGGFQPQRYRPQQPAPAVRYNNGGGYNNAR